MDLNEKRIYIAGSDGMVGGAVVRRLRSKGAKSLLNPSRRDLDLRDQTSVFNFFADQRPDAVVIAAARVGGIWANSHFRGDFLYDNLAIALNLIEAARRSGVEKLLFLGSSVVYPLDCKQPIREEQLLTSSLEQTNEPYAIAKIAGLKLCENYHRQYGCNFYTAVPPNLYGANDNFDLRTSHVIPALIRKFHEAKISAAPLVHLWGTGQPRREFMYTNDLADAIIFLLEGVDAGDLSKRGAFHINVGTGEEIPIHQLAEKIASIVGYSGRIEYDSDMPDGAPRKILDHTMLKEFGWTAKTGIDDGLRETYRWYTSQETHLPAAQ